MREQWKVEEFQTPPWAEAACKAIGPIFAEAEWLVADSERTLRLAAMAPELRHALGLLCGLMEYHNLRNTHEYAVAESIYAEAAALG